MVLEKEFNCCGCASCTTVCPTKYLEMKENTEGFLEVSIKGGKCINCNLCEKVCPMLKEKPEEKNIEAISIRAKEKKTLDTCSSGGAIHEIAKECLKQGYKICGVVYNYKENKAEHCIIARVDKLEQLKGSKYIQSDSYVAFNKLFDGEKYLVVGTPCQIAGLKQVAKIKKCLDKFLFIDFYCHGVPSQHIWENYIKYTKKKMKVNEIKRIEFRSKKYGWHNFTISIEDDRKQIFSDKEKDKDMFYQFFLGNHALNKCCYDCQFRLTNSEADLRAGDLWGKKYENNREGVSGALVFNNNIKEILDKLEERIVSKTESIETVNEGQMHHSIIAPKYRERLILDCKKNKNIKVLYYKYIIKNKVIRRIKKVFS